MPNSDKAWMWVCMDWSDGELAENEKLAARFQNKEAAEEFKTKFEAA